MVDFHVIGADTLAAKQAVKTAGIDGVLVQAYWDRMQNGGPGSALDNGAIDTLNQQIKDARDLGLTVSFEYGVHYPPAWVKTSVLPFKDQAGIEYTSSDPGKDVRNWIWSQAGRTYFDDFCTKVYNGLTAENKAAIKFVKFGGGYYGEIQYPVEMRTNPHSFWGYDSVMQTGTGIATGLTVCPLPGYTLFSGTDAQDVQWINWYLAGIENFITWQIKLLKRLGFKCPLYALHSGYSTRRGQTRSQAGWRENFARGQDFVRALGVYKNDPQVWPWCTWLGGYDGWTPNSVDTDQAAWKKLYVESKMRGKNKLIGGENTGGEDNSALTGIISNSFVSPSTGPIYERIGSQPYEGYKRMQWLNYSDLTGNASGRATLSHYASQASAQKAK